MKTIKKLLKYIAIFILSLFTYLLIVTLLSFISVNEDLAENQQEIPIYILTNGVHTDIVLPIKNEHHDWSTQLKFEHTKSKDSTYQYVALGWGDKGFYLETPTWADLKTSPRVLPGANAPFVPPFGDFRWAVSNGLLNPPESSAPC